MLKHLDDFSNQRFNERIIVKEIGINNLYGKLSDSYYHFQIFACHICKHRLKSFMSLICHYSLCHNQLYVINYALYTNTKIELQENHLILYPNSVQSQVSSNNFSIVRIDFFAQIQNILNETCLDNLPIVSVGRKDKERVMKDIILDRVYFHSVTSRILNSDSDDEDYFVDPDEVYSNMAERIDEHTDINVVEKDFLKLWNQFMLRNGEITYLKPQETEKLLKEFYEKYRKKIKEQRLKDCFILHVINLYDYMKLTSDEMMNVMKILEQ
jgi:hypothetical protein